MSATIVDLGPAAAQLARLVRSVRDDQLEAPTPCPEYTLGDLLNHVADFVRTFVATARKEVGDITKAKAPASGERLDPDWREQITGGLDDLVEAWRDPAAWTGETEAGGVPLPGEVAGLVAVDELVVHGWDVARASGQPFDADEASIRGALGFVAQFETVEGIFGPRVPVPDDAPLLDQLLGRTGRDPGWSAS